MLAALWRPPRGLVSVRQVAGAAKVSPTCASRALTGLQGKRLAVTAEPVVFDGRAERRKVWEVNWGSPEWLRVAPAVGKAVLPAGQTPVPRSSRLPARLASSFWTGDWRKVNVEKDTAYVAQRILEEGRSDPEAIAFRAQLPSAALGEAHHSRHPVPLGGGSVTDFPAGTEAVLSGPVRTAWATDPGPPRPRCLHGGGRLAVALRLQHRTRKISASSASAPLASRLCASLVESVAMVRGRRHRRREGTWPSSSGVPRSSSPTLRATLSPIHPADRRGRGRRARGSCHETLRHNQPQTIARLRRPACDRADGRAKGRRRAGAGCPPVPSSRQRQLRNIRDSIGPVYAMCGPDPLVVTPRQELNSYWVRRAAEVVAGSSRWDVPVLDDDQAEALFGPLPQGRDGTGGEV